MAGSAVLRHVVTFGRVLREAGLEVGPGRLEDALAGLDQIDLTCRDDVYWTLRTTLVTRREELDAFDRAFNAWFLRAPVRPPRRLAPDPVRGQVLQGRRGDADRGPEQSESAGEVTVGWSADEVLRAKDFSSMTPEEFARARALMTAIASARPRRRTRRLRPHPRGRELDLRRLARSSLASGGDPIDPRFRRRVDGPRKLVVLCDVSGSMEAYSRALLLFLHALVGCGPGVEVFAFGTRLTRLTTELRTRDPEQALERAAGSVVDWASGTRIGASLKSFNDVWGRRALSRGAVVVIVSDGWERQDAGGVGAEMARLARAAYAVVWVNPLKGNPAYQPLAGGMRAALPYVDRFLAGHTLSSLEELAGVLAGIERRHAA
ncbi:MAG: VWA domain-containing protein [Actinobacteria bacterium]|nr:VWA domain-containing protein [Actinomycetota bacterium]